VLEDFEGTRLSDLAKKTRTAILETATQELRDEDCVCLWGWIHFKEVLQTAPEALPASSSSEAARQSLIQINGKSYPMVHVNGVLLRENPKAWYASACTLLEDRAEGMHLKEILIREMGRRIATDRRAGICLRKLLSSAETPDVRALCATAMAAAMKGKQPALRNPFLRTLRRDPDPQVKAACAAALRTVARTDLAVRGELEELLRGTQADEVRAGAARGLAGAALAQSTVSNLLFEFARCESTPERVRAACAWGVAPQIGKSPEANKIFKSWLDDSRCRALQRVAAQALAKAMAAQRLDWDHGVVEKIEGVLMSLTDPCQCALDSLEELADARAVRHGLRLEAVLRDALGCLANRVELAFVFGSTARNRQHAESDIDLFVLGDVSLKALAGPLQQAENTLGRRINPVIHTRESFRIRYAAGDPFLLDVYRREKVPVLLPPGQTSREDLDSELRTMAAERVATAQ
jgi:predicted nucleotidyltransferase